MPQRKTGRPRGRPTTGLNGEPTTGYRRLCIRLPAETLALVARWAKAAGLPRWRIVDQAINRAAPRKINPPPEVIRGKLEDQPPKPKRKRT